MMSLPGSERLVTPAIKLYIHVFVCIGLTELNAAFVFYSCWRCFYVATWPSLLPRSGHKPYSLPDDAAIFLFILRVVSDWIPYLSEFLHLPVGQVLETHSIRDHLWFDPPHIFGISVEKFKTWQGRYDPDYSPSSTHLAGSKSSNSSMEG